MLNVAPHVFLLYVLKSACLYFFFKVLHWTLKPYITRSHFHGIPGPPSASWITGNLGQLFTSKGLPFHNHIVNQYGGMVKVYGFFGDEQLYVSDPRALHSIVVKDQDAFEETAVFVESNKVVFGPGLVSTVGEQHKRQRKVVKPVFSVPYLKKLTPLMYSIADKLANVMSDEIKGNPTQGAGAILDMSEWVSRVALETVGQAVLGYSFDPLDSHHSNPYTSAVKELIPTLFSLSLVRQFAPFLSRLGSPAFRRKLVELTPVKAVQKVKNMSDVMFDTAKDILRRKSETLHSEGLDHNADSKDIISELLRANEHLPANSKLSNAELIGQMTVLIFGAQDTTASALSRLLFMLAAHPDVQKTLKMELETARGNTLEDRLSYDQLVGLPWLDAVIKETLRLYPPVPFVRRTAVKERSVPYTSPEGEVCSVLIPKGTTLFISIAGANRSEAVWGPDAKEWKPQRWMSADPPGTVLRLPGIYAGTMSFLGGSRSCVGYKFADLEIKILLATLLTRFSFSATKDKIVWNLSQIISPSVRKEPSSPSDAIAEHKGLPLFVCED